MGRGNKIVIQNTELTKSLTQVTALPPGLCPAPALSSFGLPGFCRPSVRPQPCMVPYRETTLVVFAYRSDNHAAVLRLQNTQPKDRRVYNAPYRNPCCAVAVKGRRQGHQGQRGRHRQGTQARGYRRPEAATMFFIHTIK